MPPARDDAIVTLRPVPSGVAAGTEVCDGVHQPDPVLWYVTVTVAGDAADPAAVRRGLERLSTERPFVVSARYRADRAEVRYWDESDDVAVAVGQAIRMWGDHRASAALPDWHVVGLEVLDRETARRRWKFADQPQVLVLGEIRTMEDEDA